MDYKQLDKWLANLDRTLGVGHIPDATTDALPPIVDQAFGRMTEAWDDVRDDGGKERPQSAIVGALAETIRYWRMVAEGQARKEQAETHKGIKQGVEDGHLRYPVHTRHTFTPTEYTAESIPVPALEPATDEALPQSLPCKVCGGVARWTEAREWYWLGCDGHHAAYQPTRTEAIQKWNEANRVDEKPAVDGTVKAGDLVSDGKGGVIGIATEAPKANENTITVNLNGWSLHVPDAKLVDGPYDMPF